MSLTSLIYVLLGLLVFFLIIFVFWAWMMLDWLKRLKSDPDNAKPYVVWMIIGLPIPYFLNVYRRLGPAKAS